MTMYTAYNAAPAKDQRDPAQNEEDITTFYTEASIKY